MKPKKGGLPFAKSALGEKPRDKGGGTEEHSQK
jgi:hypothetical protein